MPQVGRLLKQYFQVDKINTFICLSRFILLVNHVLSFNTKDKEIGTGKKRQLQMQVKTKGRGKRSTPSILHGSAGHGT